VSLKELKEKMIKFQRNEISRDEMILALKAWQQRHGFLKGVDDD
jgi:hypothetical protein